MRSKTLGFAAAAAGLLMAANAIGQSGAASLTVQAGQPGTVVSSNLFGIFFEEISMAGDGGIYAELIRNRSFEDNTTSPVNWSLVTNGTAVGTMALDTSLPMSGSNVYSLALTKTGGTGSVGAANNGYFGIPLTNGATYKLELYARGAAGFSGNISVSLESTNGSTVYAQTTFSGLTAGWQHFTAALVSSGTDANAQLVCRIAQTGTVYLDFVSLFPAATFNNRTNGLRPDLMGKLVDLQPAFMRFPGGSWVDGTSLANAYHWKPTAGFLPDRTVRANVWGYMVDNGLGYHEYLQMCEDLGAEPLFDVNAGMVNNSVYVLPADLGPWIQEALDAIEYANGDTSTTYGAMRAANGHPAPFNLKYIEIGNENGGTAYNANYALFYDAIKSNYPSMHIIANVWGGIPSSRTVEIMDEHYYASANTFISYANKYDSYSRTGPKVFVGEYAVAYNVGPGFRATLLNALGEAAFMTGMERNSDIVTLSCYAPLFVNVNQQSWTPDMIYFDGTRVSGTPSYYVQKLFSQNRGDCVLPVSVTVPGIVTNPTPRGAIGVGSWSTSVEYTNIVVTSNGVTLYQSNFANNGTDGWRVHNHGTWSTNGGLYRQTSTSATDCRSTTGDTGWANYSLTLRARKVSGSEGFLILFNWVDDNNWTWLNLGGWGNTQHGIEYNANGTTSILGTRVTGSIQTNVWYDIRVDLNGTNIQCYLDGAQILNVNSPSTSTSGIGLYASSVYDRASGQVVVKVVNPYYGQPMSTTFNLAGVNSVSSNATLIQLTSVSSADENSLTAPTKVSPVTSTLTNAGTNFTLTLPADSLSILRLNTGGLNSYTNLLLQIPTPINTGQAVAATVLAMQSGVWTDLTTNANHAITYRSLNPDVATVDINGMVTARAAGTAAIVAAYGGLGLYATQTVQVVKVPTGLVHRYSFSETSGTNVADTIGGASWGGTLPKGGAFAGGQLTLASNLQQYVNLPAGILSNYTQVTIETWATFGTLPGGCFLYGFGNKSGSWGVNYIFCQPKDGRIALSDYNWTGEQGTTGGGNWSGRTVHVTTVFNPPDGTIALYTNGVLVSQNTAVTKSLSVVSNAFSYIARSLYSGDSYMDVSLDEFRIYSGALSVGEVAATQVLGPDALLDTNAPVVSASMSAGSFAMSWPVASAGYTVFTTTNLTEANWSAANVSPQIVGNQWQFSLLATNGSARYFRLAK